MLFNVAGTSTSAAFVDTDYKEFLRLVDINYLGSAYATRAFLPHMISKGTTDHPHPRAIVFTSSQAGQLGVYGYTAYSASKYALRGLAEALQMEVARDNVSVQLAFPPDTDTPGFEEEQIGKPEETKLISQTSGLFSADR
jgi:3-dehydrosphinganine reductase